MMVSLGKLVVINYYNMFQLVVITNDIVVKVSLPTRPSSGERNPETMQSQQVVPLAGFKCCSAIMLLTNFKLKLELESLYPQGSILPANES